ncbi:MULTISPECIES: hypothetical protein [Flavobacterium]|uniref:hypothetical protein n=1 Tax=Flavobacterium TaxID=237 RepID=UPI0009673937|nr:MULTISPECIES: hypothetical protein [Flavobacterium]MBN9283605.1 hypothetical protein [Flavobacterium sp.]OJV69286.1 MAG: hypothetical protein BGO42_12975 [Flavobacterium sp. 40-81]
MMQPWIHRAKTDTIFILAPSFLVLGIIVLGQQWLLEIEAKHSFYIWLFLIVFIDVAHVYATLFKTYFVSSEFQKRKKLMIGLPVLCFCIGLVLFSFGSRVFWSVLAYVAVFHFIRQQYGFMRLYSRNEPRLKRNKYFDSLVIYTVTGYPMLYWFFSPERNFNWFMPNEFLQFENEGLLEIFRVFYFLILVVYVLSVSYKAWKNRFFNIPKNAIIAGTALSWYFGIVYYNNDLIFTMLNVVSHGIPYMALIFLKEIDGKGTALWGAMSYLTKFKGVVFYLGILLLIAFLEEYIWEIAVWNEQFSMRGMDFTAAHFVLVPLLAVPQFTHYVLDGFIWKSK